MRCIQTKKRLAIFFSLILAALALITAELNLRFPNEVYIYNGESLTVREGLPYTVELAANTGGILKNDGRLEHSGINGEKNGYTASLKLFGIIPVKNVHVNVSDACPVTVSGKTVGIKIYTKGLVVAGISEITAQKGISYNLGTLYDIKSGDIILSANNKEMKKTEDFADIVINSGGEKLELKIVRNGKNITKEVKAVKTNEGYKLGFWVRDSTAGIGTLTFINNKNGCFGALGHPIADADSGVLMPTESGEITEASVEGVNKGRAGIPGELKGIFKTPAAKIGDILKNTEKGIYGKITTEYNTNGKIFSAGSRNSIQEGKAFIVSNVTNDKTEAFEIEIERVMRYNIDNYKDLVIKVTDERLLEKTGGIVQGMSGSPIIQNDKIVGAVTHVFVNDPTRGYGIFIDNMLKETENIIN